VAPINVAAPGSPGVGPLLCDPLAMPRRSVSGVATVAISRKLGTCDGGTSKRLSGAASNSTPTLPRQYDRVEVGHRRPRGVCDGRFRHHRAWNHRRAEESRHSLDRVRNCRLYAYEFDSLPLRLKLADAGYWVAQRDVIPLSINPVGDLLARHAEAEIEFRIVPSLCH
jgi:hypothetical protein